MSTDIGWSTWTHHQVLTSQMKEETMSDMTVYELVQYRVQLGVNYLGNSYGGATGLDWLSKVNLVTLRMSDNVACVLGQVTGDFATSPLVIMLGFKQASAWGFYLTADDMDAGLTYDDLTAEWKRQIAPLNYRRAERLYQLETAGVTDSWYEEDV